MSASSSSSSSARSSSQDALELLLAGIWESTLGVRDVGLGDTLRELGVDSLRAARMLVEVQHRFDIDLPLSVLVEAPTIESLAAVIRRGPNEALWRSVVPIRAAGSRPPLFLVHPGGGSVLGYLPLADLLDPEQPVFALQPQGADGSRMATRIADIAAHYVDGVRAVRPTGPYVLAGFSFGGLAAWEMAQRLRRGGQSVPLLILLDTQRPSARRFVQRHWRRLRGQSPLDALGYLTRKALGRARQEIDGLRLSLLGRASRRSERPPLPGEIELRSKHATRRYRPRPYAGRVLLVQTTPERACDWRPLVRGGFDVRTVACDHLDLLAPPHLEAVADHLRQALEELSEA